MSTAPPLNYTTKIGAARTTGECMTLLAKAGASSVSVLYENAQPVGLAFSLATPHGRRDFTLPVSIDGLASVLRNADYPPGVGGATLARYMTREHAARVAWRIMKDWLEAQLALIAAGMALLPEIMLPYLRVDEGRTLWQAYQERERDGLTAGGAQ